MANLAAIIAGSRRNYGVDKYNPDPEARRLALQRALMAQQYQTAMSAPAGPYSGTKKALAGFQLGRQNRAEQRRNALREAARRAYFAQMLAGGPAAASGGAPGGASALMPMEKSFPAMEGGPQPPPGQLAQLNAAQEVRNQTWENMSTSDPREWARARQMGWEKGRYLRKDLGDSVADPTVAEAAGEASYDIPAQGMMEWADIEGTSLSGAPLDDTVVTEETEVSGPGDLTIRETGAAEVEDDDDRHLLSQFGDFLLGGRELTPELAAKRVAEMSPAELQKAAGFAPGQMALMEAIRSGDPKRMQLALAIMNPQDLAKHLLTKPKEPDLKGPIWVTDPKGVKRQRWLTPTDIQRFQNTPGYQLEKVAGTPIVQIGTKEEAKLRAKQKFEGSPAQKKLDEAFGTALGKLRASGALAPQALEKNERQIQDVIKQLEAIVAGKSKQSLSGIDVGLASQARGVMAITHPDALQALERVEEVVQRNLRIILGAQFTQKEGDRLISRAYNPWMNEESNLVRLRSLAESMAAQIKEKLRAVKHFEETGSLRLYKGKAPDSREIVDRLVSTVTKESPIPIEKWDKRYFRSLLDENGRRTEEYKRLTGNPKTRARIAKRMKELGLLP
jgi:hypothetical protein